MAESKKKDTKKIVDVSHPGKTAPSGNSKSVIVGHGPMIKDPMVVEGEVPATPAAPEKTTVKSGEAVIAPLADSPSNKDADTKAKKDEPAVELSEDDGKKTIAVLAEEAAVKEEETKDAESEEAADTKIAEATPSEPQPEAAAEEPAADTEEESTAEKQDDKTDIGTDDKAATQSVTEAEAEELAAQEKHDAEIQKLIDSKTYSLPIKTVEQRRSKRVVILGILLSIVLIAAWADISLDAGLVKVSGVPHTHFFDQQTSVSVETVDPAPTTKNYTAKYSKLTFKYPTNWVVEGESSSTNDGLYVLPKAEATNPEKGSVSLAFASPAINATSDAVTIKYVNYQKLPNKIGGIVYVRDMVYQVNQTGTLGVNSSLSNTNTDTVESQSSMYGKFLNADGKSSSVFNIIVYKSSGGKSGFTSVKSAQEYMKTPDYQKARSVLLSTTAN